MCIRDSFLTTLANPATSLKTATPGVAFPASALRLLVLVVLDRRHRLAVVESPLVLLDLLLAELDRHRADVRGDGAAARADVIDAGIERLARVAGHLATAQLQRIELRRELLEAGEVVLVRGRAIGN